MKKFMKTLVFVLSFAMLVSLAPMSILAACGTGTEQTTEVQEITGTGELSQSGGTDISILPQENEETGTSNDPGSLKEETTEEKETTAEKETTKAKTMEELAENELAGGETISKGGTYTLKNNTETGEKATGTITINTTEPVTIVGEGVEWDNSFTVTSTKFENLKITAGVAGVNLTLKDLYIEDRADTSPLVDLQGTGNKLGIEGRVLLEKYGQGRGTYAAVHVAKGTDVVINGKGELYLYKTSGGSGIGGNANEMNGDITFGDAASSLKAFIKGSKQGAVIGAGTGASQSTAEPGFVKFVEGEYNLISNSRGAVIGGSAGSEGASDGTTVYIEKKANVNINTDYSGASIGGGGYSGGNDASGGKLYVNGGSLRVYIDKNAAGNTTGWMGRKYTAGVNDASITAQRLNSNNENVYKLTLDTAIEGISSPYTVKVDDEEFYVGTDHRYGYVQEALDKGEQLAITSTPSNWYNLAENNLYLYLTGKDHKITINGIDVQYYWDEVTESFSTVKKYPISFVITDGTDNITKDASVIISEGIIYSYKEEKAAGKFAEADDSTAAHNVYGLKEGKYTATITKDGYYASSFSFSVDANGAVKDASGGSRSNIFDYLSGTTFTIPLKKCDPSSNPGAWDGKTLDVSWYTEDADKYYISTSEQLAGLAAIVNGIFNAEITTIKDSDGTYTAEDYAKLETRKIRHSNSKGSTGGNNLVTTSDFWFGVKSDDKTPADFNGKEIYITADLDMGGYKSGDAWTGARYMTIGGQSLMNYIDYGAWKSDGYSHLGSSFNGKLFGQGHIIKNMYCDRYGAGANFGDSQSVGLVGRLGTHDSDPAGISAVDPTVRDLAVTGYVYARRSVGGIVGKIGQTSASKLKDGSVGGIIENCINFAEVHNTDSKGCGGIVGASWNKGRIRNCANFGYIWTTYRCPTGGIGGSNEVPIINCYNAGKIEAGTATYAMAIGTNNGGATTIENNYWLTGTPKSGQGYYKGTGAVEITDNYNESGLTAVQYMQSESFLSDINGNGRAWVTPADTDAICQLMQEEGFAGYPVQRVFTDDQTKITKILKTGDPSKLTYYEGQTFEAAGLQICAVYSDGGTEFVENYVISNTDPLKTTDTSINISGEAGGKSFSYDYTINVLQNECTQLVIRRNPDNKVYAQGEPVDTTGMKVGAKYANFPNVTVDLEEADYTSELSKDNDGKDIILVKYVFNGKELTASVPVTVYTEAAPELNEEGFYEITCQDHLAWFANQVVAKDQYEIKGKIMNDFDVDQAFEGIGTSSEPFKGVIDGNEHTVNINRKITSGIGGGLVNYADNATIKNLTIEGSITNTSRNNALGAFIGQITVASGTDAEAAHVTTIENCVNKANVDGQGITGGIAGQVFKGSAVIKDSKNYGAVSSTSAKGTGGIIGMTQNYFNMSNHNDITGCENYGDITAEASIAGIAGEFSGDGSSEVCRIADCMNYGNVTASGANGSNAAGIVGRFVGHGSDDSLSPVIENCGNNGTIEGNNEVGGIAGYNYRERIKIDKCFNTGDITAKGSNAVDAGGIAGFLSGTDIQNVYNQGNIRTTSDEAGENSGVGGLIGTYSGKVSGSLLNAYSTGNVETSGNAKAGALIGKTATDLDAENVYALEDTAEELAGVLNGKTIFGNNGFKTAEELKALAGTLGEGYKENTTEIYHGGYPVLVWENTDADHLWGDAVVTKEPTCTEKGVKTYTCKIHKDIMTEDIPALGHADADHDGECDVCGEALKGFVKLDNGSWRLYSSDSKILTGFQKVGSGWYYFNPDQESEDYGKMATGLNQIGNGKYLFRGGDSGRMLTGFQKYEGDWYYFRGGDSGRMLTGFQKINGYWFYMDAEQGGKVLFGFQKIGSGYYLFKGGESGRMLTGWQKVDGNWKYFKGGDSGRMLTGWQAINSKYYYLDPATGNMKTGWLELGQARYYLNSNGTMATGWKQIDGNWYYFRGGSSGRMLTGKQNINGQVYYFDSNGAWLQ